MTSTLERSGGKRSRAVREHLDAAAIGRRLREARLAAGLSQRQLVIGSGYTAAYVSRLEAGERLASVSCLRVLSARLPVTVGWLESGDGAGGVDLVLSHVDAVELLSALDAVAWPGGMPARLVEQLRTGLGLPERPGALQRLLAGEQVGGEGVSSC